MFGQGFSSVGECNLHCNLLSGDRNVIKAQDNIPLFSLHYLIESDKAFSLLYKGGTTNLRRGSVPIMIINLLRLRTPHRHAKHRLFSDQ